MKGFGMSHHHERKVFVSKAAILVDGKVPTEEEKNTMNNEALAKLAKALERRRQERLRGGIPPLGSKR